MTNVNVQFKKWRLQAGLSQGDVSKQLGYKTNQMVSNVERGICSYPLTSCRKIAIVLGITERDFKQTYFKYQVVKLKDKLGI